jgi:ubiquinone/menaquinone biosynthesis C-methylase UbiE
MRSVINTDETARARARYDRNAPFYDRICRGAEKGLAPYRAELWRQVKGPRVLEVGVGTGSNMPYYQDMAVTAIDFSPRMLEQARTRAVQLGVAVELHAADAQALPFPSNSFETVIATCVFCSVPDSLLGLEEARRVLVPGGQLLLLEHVLSKRPRLRRLMRLVNPLAVRLCGANIDRETVENVHRAEFVDLRVEDLWLDILKRIEASAPTPE